MQKRSLVYLVLLAHGVKLLPGFYVGLFMKQTINRKKKYTYTEMKSHNALQHLQHYYIISVQQQLTMLQNHFS